MEHIYQFAKEYLEQLSINHGGKKFEMSFLSQHTKTLV